MNISIQAKNAGPVTPRKTLIAAALSALVYCNGIQADAASGRNIAPLKDGMPYLFVVHRGRSVKVERDIDRSFSSTPEVLSALMLTSNACPPFCLQPMQLDSPVETVGELEVVDFMATTMRDNKGVLLDVRPKREYDVSTIPGSVNHSIVVIKKGLGDPDFETMLESLGAKRRGEVSSVTRLLEDWGLTDTSELTPEWDFTGAKELIIWSKGPTSDLGPQAISVLLEAGYPAGKLSWYRGGLPAWQYWGFTTVKAPKR